MANLKTPYLKMRNGRPRWEPGPHLRDRGWKGRNLKDEDGNWLDELEAHKAAKAINDETDAWKNDQSRSKNASTPSGDKPPITETRTVQALFDNYMSDKNPRFARNNPRTQKDYRNKANIFIAEFGGAPIAAVKKSFLHRFWEEQYEKRGHAMANAIMAVVRAAFSHAVRHDWIQINPALKMELPQVPPRQVLWLPKEILHLVKTGDRMEMWSVPDATIAALHSGQRQGDVLYLPDRLFEDDKIKLTQSKRAALIDAPMTPQLIERVNQIRERKRKLAVPNLEALVICESTNRPYSRDLFGKKFAIVRAEAAKEMPSIADKRFQDLRDTAVTRLWEAQCTMAEICAITGHKIETANQIMKHYLVLNQDMAASAIKKLTTHLEEQGIEL